MEGTFLVESDRLLREATTKLSKGEIESAIVSIAEAKNKLVRAFSLNAIGPNEYDLLRQIVRLMQCAMLHYYALALREQGKEDNALTLAYLGHALGINISLDSLLLPLIEKRLEIEYNRNEILWLSRLNNGIREPLCRFTTQVISEIKGRNKAELAENVEISIAKIIDSVNPNVPSLRELAVNLGRKFEAGDFKQARKIFEFVRDEIQYIYDPMGLEAIQSPETTLGLRAGDCEDQAILLSSLLSAVGFESALIFADADNDGVADHVYSAVYIPTAPDYTKPFRPKKLKNGKNLSDWIPLDPASQDSDFGVIPIQDLQILKLAPVPP